MFRLKYVSHSSFLFEFFNVNQLLHYPITSHIQTSFLYVKLQFSIIQNVKFNVIIILLNYIK